MQLLLSFVKSEVFCGLLLFICALCAILLANSPWAYIPHAMFETPILHSQFTGHFLINDIFMSFFFLQVGLELRHEISYGALAKLKHALLPIIAAIGGVILPALIYICFNHSPHLIKGWAIPTATDIAFALGIYSLLHNKFPRNLRIILLSIAIIDDIIAILIIAIFYSTNITIAPLFFALFISLFYYYFNNKYNAILSFVILWLCLYKGGIHPTLSGVIIGLLTKQNATHSNFTNLLNKIIAFFIMPLFSFANSNISFSAVNFYNKEDISLILGIAIALLIGKPLGIFGAGYLGIICKICNLPKAIELRQFLFISIISGIGFTMALFTILLSFAHNDIIQSAKLGVTFGSLLAAITGLLYGYLCPKHKTDL